MTKRRSEVELYETMRDAIIYLRAHAHEKPSSLEVAKTLGMSQSRFDHAFKEWVGISPKRYLSYLSKERAKELLKDSSAILQTSHRAGLSGPGRLHELMITHEGVSPGEYKSGEIEISYGIYASPFGWCVIGTTKRGICTIAFLDSDTRAEAERLVREYWPKATVIRDQKGVERYAKHIFGSSSSKQKLPIVLKGTNFQIKVWEALLRIPEGHAATYADIARSIGSPRAVRAVGSACGRNAIGYLIPCHRVLTSQGGIGGYHWGAERKEALLAYEAAKVPSKRP